MGFGDRCGVSVLEGGMSVGSVRRWWDGLDSGVVATQVVMMPRSVYRSLSHLPLPPLLITRITNRRNHQTPTKEAGTNGERDTVYYNAVQYSTVPTDGGTTPTSLSFPSSSTHSPPPATQSTHHHHISNSIQYHPMPITLVRLHIQHSLPQTASQPRARTQKLGLPSILPLG